MFKYYSFKERKFYKRRYLFNFIFYIDYNLYNGKNEILNHLIIMENQIKNLGKEYMERNREFKEKTNNKNK